jgi:hypothetical protein
MRGALGNKLKLGLIDGKGVPLEMTPEMRSTHLYVCGSTGTGKSKMLEYLIQQDIANWSDSKCGMLVIDPHGSLYDSLINWLAWNQPYLKKVPIVPIDLRQSDWTIAYNVMRPRAIADPSVVVSNFVQAMAYVWGADGTDKTPLFARLAKEILWPVYEKKMSLGEVKYLIDRTDKRLRSELTQGLSKESVARGWAFRMRCPRVILMRNFQAPLTGFMIFWTQKNCTSCLDKPAVRLILARPSKRDTSSLQIFPRKECACRKKTLRYLQRCY